MINYVRFDNKFCAKDLWPGLWISTMWTQFTLGYIFADVFCLECSFPYFQIAKNTHYTLYYWWKFCCVSVNSTFIIINQRQILAVFALTWLIFASPIKFKAVIIITSSISFVGIICHCSFYIFYLCIETNIWRIVQHMFCV